MDLNLSGKIALLTAASRGLGKAIATELSREGAEVIICSRDEEKITSAAREIERATGNRVIPFVVNVKEANDIKHLFQHVKNQYDKLDVLLCNAGGPPGGSFESFDDPTATLKHSRPSSTTPTVTR